MFATMTRSGDGSLSRDASSRFPHLAAALSLVLAAGCDTGSGDSSERLGGTVGAPLMSVRTPTPLAQSRIRPEALVLELSVNGQPVAMTRQGERWTGSTRLAEGAILDLVVAFSSEGIPLASYEESGGPVTGNTTVTVSAGDYVVFDDDGDGFTNIEEIDGESDPFDPGSVPTTVDVEIERISPDMAPAIDGLYDEVWREATFNDVDGERLSIDNPMIVRDVGPLTMTPNYQWAAFHDDANLYLFVLGKPVYRDPDETVETPVFADSRQIWNDDALNLFVDGDNSKGSSYDGVDDWHVFIALSDDGGSNTERQRVAAGPSSVGIPAGLRFRTCICTTGRHSWELVVPLASLGIEPDRPFGIALQIDEDNNGGGRDARFGWIHPPRGDEDVDFTFLEPRFMGTARLTR